MTQMNTQTGIDKIRAAASARARAEMAKNQINPSSPEAVAFMQSAISKVEDQAWDKARDKALQNLMEMGVPGIQFISNEDDAKALGSPYQTNDDDIDSYSRLAADQFVKGMQPITWDAFKNNRRGIISASAEGILGTAIVSLEGFAGGVASGIYSGIDLARMAWQPGDITPEMYKTHLEDMSYVQKAVPKWIRNTVLPKDWMGAAYAVAGAPGEPVLASEQYGYPGGDVGEFIVRQAEDVGSALGSLPASIPSMLAPDMTTRAIAMAPFAFSGYAEGKMERYRLWKEQLQLAEELGIAPPPLPSIAEFETWGGMGAAFEVGSEFVGDTLQVGAIKLATGTKLGRLGWKPLQETIEALQDSMTRTRGPMGIAKRVVASTVVPGVMEGAEEFVPHLGEQAQDVATQVLFTPDDSYWNGKVDRELWGENSYQSFKVGAIAGSLMGGGHYVASPSAFKRRREAREVAAEVGKGTSFVTESLMQVQQSDAAQRMVAQPTGKARTTKQKALENFRRSVVPTRSSAMAMHHVEQLRAGTRGIMVVDPADLATTITPAVKDRMNALGISTKPIGTIDGKKVFAANGDIAQVEDMINNGDFAALGGNPLRNDGQVMMGAVVLRDNAGRVVEIMPYSDPAQLNQEAIAIAEYARRNGLKAEPVNHQTPLTYADVVDSLRRQQDADAVELGIPQRERQAVRKGESGRGISSLRMDIARVAKGSKTDKKSRPSDPFKTSNAYLTEEEIGDATNADVTVTVALNRVAEENMSSGEKRLSQITDANATILDGKVVFAIKQKDGSVKTIEKPIQMNGAYVSQASPDGVFLVRENGTAMTARSAFAIALHEMRHRTLSRSKAGAEYFAKLLQIDPAYAMRGGAQYMRQLFDQKLGGMSDAQVIAYYRGLHEATQAVMQGVATAEQQKTIDDAGGLAQARSEIRTFSEESVTTTADRTAGQTLLKAAEWEGIYKDAQERSFRRFSSWMANALVKNGFAGPEAQQALFELRQRMDNVREEEIQIHRKFSDDVSASFKKDLEQSARREQARRALQGGQPAGAAPASTPAAAPSSGVSPSLRQPSANAGGTTIGGDDDKRQQIDQALAAVQEAQNAPPEQRDSMLANAIGMLTQVAPLLTQTSAQVMSTTKATRPELQSKRTREIPAEMRNVVGEQPAAAQAVQQTDIASSISSLEASARRQRNAQNAMTIIQGGRPTEPVDLGTVARIQRAQTFAQAPEEEIRMSVRERPGRREANEDVRRIRNAFMDDRGIEPEAQIEETYAEVDPEFAKKVADWYESTPVNYDDPQMRAAYAQFGKETKDQYQYLVDQGYEMIPWGGKGQPYSDSADMIEDLRKNKRLYYYKTVNPDEAATFGSDPAALQEAMRKNPLLEDAGVEVLDSEGNPYQQTYNDLFRAVHDIMGHGAEGFQFGARGEENAYRSHAVMFSPLARQAMATETRGQNSWVNFGPNRRNPDGSVWGQEDPRYKPWLENLKQGVGYADQKPMLMPQELLGLYEAPQQARASLRPITREEMTPAMQAWSEGSKVVDENGALIPVYHGTSKDKDFNKFKIGKRGAWFTTNPQDASMYAMQNDSMGFKREPTQADPWASRRTNTASRVIPAVLNLKNPANYYRDVSTEDKKLLETSQNYALAQARVFDKLRRQGFDGVDMGNGVYVAFNPNQVKGYFNANPTADERIMYSQRGKKPAKALTVEQIAANDQKKAEQAAKQAAAAQKRREAEIARKRKQESSVRREAKLAKPAISISAEVTATPYINPNIITTTAQQDPQFSTDRAYARINDQIAELLSNTAYKETLGKAISAATDGRVKSIGSPRRILGSFQGRVEQSMRISVPGATHEDHVLISNLLGSLLMQEASITIGEPTANTPKAEQSYAMMMYADPNISDSALRTLLAQADNQLGGASTTETGKGIFAVYTPYAGNPLTKKAFEANAIAFAAANNLTVKAAPVRSTYTVTGASDVLGRKRKAPALAGRGNRGNRGLDPRWGSWIEAAAPIVEALRDEGFDINIPGWIGRVAGADAAAVQDAIINTLAERAAGGRHGLDWRFIKRASVTGQGLTDGFAIPAKTTPANAEESFAEVDALLARHPNALQDTASFERFLIDLFKSQDIPIVPADLLDGVKDNFARMAKDMDLRNNGGRLTPTMVDEAIHGLEMAQRFRALYAAGKVTPTHTVALSMWGFLSRGVSPYIQEGLFLDIVNYRSKSGRDLSYFVNKAVAGEWTKPQKGANGQVIQPDNSVQTEWKAWVSAMFSDAKYEVKRDADVDSEGDVITKNGSIGAAASHNANAFGVSFLGNIGDPVTINGKTQSGLLHFHEALANPQTTGAQVRRVFASLGGGLGIDNKVVGFNSLLAGKTDISVYDRVRVRDHYDRSGSYPNIYDGYLVGYGVYDHGDKVADFRVDSDLRDTTEEQRRELLKPIEEQAKKAAEEWSSRGPRMLDENGNPIQPSVEPMYIAGLANMFNGARGIAIYEAVERSLNPDAIFRNLVKSRPDIIPFANLGAEHWLNWVGYSGQEASHKTIDGLIQMIASGRNTITDVWAKEGRYDTFHYGGEYGYKDVGGKPTAMYHYQFNGANWEFTPPQYNAFIKSMSSFDWGGLNWSKASGTKKPKFLVSKDSTTGKDRTEPWHSDPMIGQRGAAKIAELADQFGTRMSLRDMSNEDALDKFSVEFVKATEKDPNMPVVMGVNNDELALEFARQNIAAQTHQQAYELYLRMVKGNYPKPTQSRYTMYFDRNNAVNGIVPNDVWWHAGQTRWTSPNYNKNASQFGLHIGNFHQASWFFNRAIRDQRIWEANPSDDLWFAKRTITPVMFPLYARAHKTIEVPDMGSWQPEKILRGMFMFRHIGEAEQREILNDMYDSIGFKPAADDMIHAMNGLQPAQFERTENAGLAQSANIFLRGWLADRDIDAIQYQNTAEGLVPSEFSKEPSMYGIETEADKQWFAERRDRDAKFFDWLESNRDASPLEQVAKSKEIRGDASSLIVWNTGQVKSASAEDVGFRTSMSDIRASMRHQAPAVVNMYPEVFGGESDIRMSQRAGLRGRKDTATVNFVDKYDPLRRYGEIAERNLGMALPDFANPYQGARVLTGRLGAMQAQANVEYTNILRDMHEHGISLEQMDEFLTAQHALNGGNAYIAALNPRFPDGGTGMTNADAQAVLMRAQAAGRYGEMNRIAEDWRQMLREGLRQRRDAGLITNDLYNTLTTRYTHYVPLRGAPARPEDELFEDYDSGEVFGRGLSTQGRGMPRRYGRASRAEGVTSQVGFLHEDTMRRIARNEVAQRFLRLVTLVNDPMMAEVIRPTRPVNMTIPATRTRPERVETRYIHDTNWSSDPQNFGVFVNQPVTINGHDYEPGDLVVIRITNPDLAQAMIAPDRSLTDFEQSLRQVNNAWRFVTTGMGNPTFAPVNLIRDVGAGSVSNIASHGVRDTAQMLRRYPRSFVRVFRDAWFNPTQPTGSYREFVEAGGDQVYWRPNDLETKNTDFQQLADRVARRDPNDRTLARTLLGWYPAFFTAAETATRLAQFEQRRATGSSREQAALAAREITVDFAKGGKRKAGMNTYYMFLNASIQGSVNVTRALGRSLALAPALVTFGAVTALMGRALGGDDEDTEGDRWDNIPDYEKASNIILFDPSGSGKYLKIPLPYGYNTLYSAGVRMADAAMGKTTAGDAVAGMLTDSLNSFNPFGGSGIKQGIGSVMAAFIPTMARPAMEIALNENWMGRPIYPKSFGKQKEADAYSYFSSTPEVYTDAAQMLNEATGGDRFESGVIDMSPNTMQYLVGYYLSGAGRTVDRLVKIATSGEPTEASDVPFLRSFAGDAATDTRSLSERYNAISARVMPEVYRAEALRDPAVPREQREAIAERGFNRTDIAIGKVATDADKALRKINKAMKTATPEQRERLLQARERAMKSVIRANNRLTPD